MDPLTLLIIVLILLILFGGYGYRAGWHDSTPYVPQAFVLVVTIIIILIVLRLLRLI